MSTVLDWVTYLAIFNSGAALTTVGLAHHQMTRPGGDPRLTAIRVVLKMRGPAEYPAFLFAVALHWPVIAYDILTSGKAPK